MKHLILALFFLFQAKEVLSLEFIRNLPDKNLCQILDKYKSENTDAIIILKEQSFTIQDTDIYYGGEEFRGPSTTTTNNKIIQ